MSDRKVLRAELIHLKCSSEDAVVVLLLWRRLKYLNNCLIDRREIFVQTSIHGSQRIIPDVFLVIPPWLFLQRHHDVNVCGFV